MLTGSLSLALRYGLLIGGTFLATTGIVTATGNGHFCFDSQVVARAAAEAVALVLGGGGMVASGIGWRFWAKRRGGVT